MGLSEGNKHSVGKRAPLRHSLRTSLICAVITALLSLFLISGGRTTAEALITGLIFAALGGAVADYGYILNRFLYRRDDLVNTEEVKAPYEAMEKEAVDIFARQGIHKQDTITL